MQRIYSQLLYEMEDKKDCMLVTIVGEKGSAPRGSGASMLVGPSGRVVGSVGGGAVEKVSEDMALELLGKKENRVHEFNLHSGGVEDIGMVCGGDVTVLFQYIACNDGEWKAFAGAVCDRLRERKAGRIYYSLEGRVMALYSGGKLIAGQPVPEEQTREDKARPALEGGWYSQPLPTGSRVLIFGGGHIAQSLVPILVNIDFAPTVFDDRPDYSKPELFPGAEQCICGDFSRIGDYLEVTSDDYVVIMTNGHSNDLTVQAQIMRGSYAYLGVIGSKSKIKSVNEKLTAMGISPEALAQVHTPIGTAIRAVTPAEIAISIAGELILERAQLRDAAGEKISAGCPMH
ncbi:MAG: XdhC family protein [Oscillospiraceae bacterium]|nr:XdhC family protein [Oscillospiraceae bacterium]